MGEGCQAGLDVSHQSLLLGASRPKAAATGPYRAANRAPEPRLPAQLWLGFSKTRRVSALRVTVPFCNPIGAVKRHLFTFFLVAFLCSA